MNVRSAASTVFAKLRKLLDKAYRSLVTYYSTSPRLKKYLPRVAATTVIVLLFGAISTATVVKLGEDSVSTEVVYVEVDSYVDFGEIEPARVTVVGLNSDDAEELSFDWLDYKRASTQVEELGWNYHAARGLAKKVAEQFKGAQGRCVVVTYQGLLHERVATGVVLLTEERLRGFPKCGK